MDFPSGPDRRYQAAAASIRQLRSRLLDLTARNPLISFTHGRANGTRTHVRAVNGHVDALFAHLNDGKPLAIRPLPPSDAEPEDERGPQFSAALEATRLTDEHYQAGIAELSADETSSAKAAAIERTLRNRVRDSLGMPPTKVAMAQALADHAIKFGIDPSFDLRPIEPASARPQARSAAEFQALILPDPLERQLAKIRDSARTVAEETGVSTLHLAFGFLEWFESEASDRPITSPLVLLRVDIDRRIVASRYQYSISTVGDEAEVNLTLSERLDRDFRIKLPPLAEDETPEAYLARIEQEVCKGRPRWRVRRFVTLAHFPFARLAMFHDLDEELWPNGLASHPVIASLLGGQEAGASMFAAEHDVDAPAVLAKVPVLVLEADASQHSAVYDAMSGQNLVIEGPPGTGKSQTITNIIAAALSNGRRVLFVADKQAALQVVRDRLEKVDLGDFCLELHSGKARKTDVVASLSNRLNRQSVPASDSRLDEKLRELAATRLALTQYVDLLNAPFGALGLTIHDVLWGDRRRRDREGAEAQLLDSVALPSVETFSCSDVDARRAMLVRFERAAASALDGFDIPPAHPWWGVTRSDLPAVDMEQAVREMAAAVAAMASLIHAAEALHLFSLPQDATIDELGTIALALAALEVEDGAGPDWFAAFADPGVRSAGAEWRQACCRYRDALDMQSKQLALPAGVQPGEAGDRLAASWSAVARIVPNGAFVTDLAAASEDLRAQLVSLAAIEKTGRDAANALSSPETGDLGDLLVIISAVSLATELPKEAADSVHPELMSRESADFVVSHCAFIRTIRARRAELESQYSLSPSLEPAVLRQHAGTLAASGLFGFLTAGVRAAKLCFTGLLRTPRKCSRAAMAAALTGIAEYLEAVAAIEVEARAHVAFGVAYCGLATDVDAALAAVTWAARVRSAFPQAVGVGAWASKALLCGDPDRLRALRAMADTSEHRALQAYLARLAPTNRSFAEVTGGLHEQATSVDALASLCRELGVPGGTMLSDLPNVIAALHSTARAETASRMPFALASVPNEICPAPVDGEGAFDAALRLAGAVAALRLPEPMRSALWRASPTVVQTAVIPASAAVTAALDDAAKRFNSVSDRLCLDQEKTFGIPFGAATAGQVHARLARAASCPHKLGDWILYLRERSAAEARGLGDLLRLWDERALPYPLLTAFDRVLYHALARRAYEKNPELERFSGLGQQEARARFATLDAEAVALCRRRLAEELSRRPVPVGIGTGKKSEFTERSLILSETVKQKRHIPIRQLLARASAAIQALKPCFMMSPLSVAQYLVPGGPRFDMLVIDEASQMRPEDALEAVARCGQIVVVGDPKQLPPTAFFARSDDTNDDDEGDEDVDAESILDLAQTVLRPMRRLRWHYRSRHGSLVAFSNREFYDDDLLVFPSPTEAKADQGVASVKVDGVYKARANLAEVEAVCTAAVEHMRTRPDRSLGIATMNQVQRELIALEMDRLAAVREEVEAYRERWSDTLERFFVKNLENVQGDERDVIFVSTVFGPSSSGGKVLQRFGPINGASGHRRLNVLFTRAKHHLRLFTSMNPDDITAGPESPRGARVLNRLRKFGFPKRLRYDSLSRLI